MRIFGIAASKKHITHVLFLCFDHESFYTMLLNVLYSCGTTFFIEWGLNCASTKTCVVLPDAINAASFSRNISYENLTFIELISNTVRRTVSTIVVSRGMDILALVDNRRKHEPEILNIFITHATDLDHFFERHVEPIEIYGMMRKALPTHFTVPDAYFALDFFHFSCPPGQLKSSLTQYLLGRIKLRLQNEHFISTFPALCATGKIPHLYYKPLCFQRCLHIIYCDR